MAEASSDAAGPARGGAARARVPAHAVLDLHRPFRAPVPDSSVGAVRKVARIDARTRVVAGRAPGGRWYRLQRRTRFTRATVRVLREAGVSEVVLRRGFNRASFPLAWMAQRD